MQVDDIKRIAVVGAGLMGHGIALEFAVAGYEVRLTDESPEVRGKALTRIRGNLEMMAGLEMVGRDEIEPALARLTVQETLGDTVANADLVIEAVFEDLALKQRLFRDLDVICCPWTILASNTSTFLPSMLAEATRRPEKVLVAHYFNPPHLLPLVEVVRGPATSDETAKIVYDLMAKIGKTPALVQKEALGFIGNRIQAAILREALAIVDQGIATPEDVDVVVRNGFGRRLAVAGPFEVSEAAGLDVVARVMSLLFPAIDNSTEVSPFLAARVAQGDFGLKTGKGFFEWTPESAEALRQRIGKALVAIARLS